MRVLLQRVTEAEVSVARISQGSIQAGIVCFVGFTAKDEDKDLTWMAEKLVHLRIFADEEGKMNRSLLDVGGAILSISQFTLYGDCQKGRRPNFMQAAPPEQAILFYEQFNQKVAQYGIYVETGKFGADMAVSLVNDGPVTLLLDSKK